MRNYWNLLGQIYWINFRWFYFWWVFCYLEPLCTITTILELPFRLLSRNRGRCSRGRSSWCPHSTASPWRATRNTEAKYEAKQGERKMKRTADAAKHGTTYWWWLPWLCVPLGSVQLGWHVVPCLATLAVLFIFLSPCFVSYFASVFRVALHWEAVEWGHHNKGLSC